MDESLLDRKFEELLQAYHDAVQRDDIEEAEAIGVECLVLAGQHAAIRLTEDLRLKLEAHDHEMGANWGQAEAAYRQGLELALAEQNACGEFKAHEDLSGLYRLLGDEARALEEARAALDAARRSEMPPLLTWALESLASSLLAVGDPQSALAAAEEMLQACRDDKMYDLQRARALVMRARCAVEFNELAPAEADLASAWALLAPQAGAAMFAGVQSGLANWWAVTARMRTKMRDFRGAADAWRESVEFRRHVSRLPQLEGPYKFNALAEALHRYGLALLTANDVDAASKAFRESCTIKTSIGLPSCGSSSV